MKARQIENDKNENYKDFDKERNPSIALWQYLCQKKLKHQKDKEKKILILKKNGERKSKFASTSKCPKATILKYKSGKKLLKLLLG